MGASDRMGRRSLSLRHVTDCMIVLIVLKAWAQTPEAQNTMMCHVRGEQGVGQRGWDGRDARESGERCCAAAGAARWTTLHPS